MLGLGRRGYFIPYRYAHLTPGSGARAPYAPITALFNARRPVFRDVLTAIDGYRTDLLAIGDGAPPEPRWHQSWFPRLDGAAAYTLTRTLKPSRIVEVGSGHSTRFFARACRDENLAARITAIDPAPRADIAAMGIDIRPTTLQEAGPDAFADLASGDMVVIDSSHILMPGTDVDLWLNRLWPALPAGIILHLHDIFLPDDYPPEWDWRGYNEQLGLAPLIATGAAEVLFSSHYVAVNMTDDLAQTVIADLALPAGAFESSLWLRKTARNTD